jgi:hypothetical protein
MQLQTILELVICMDASLIIHDGRDLILNFVFQFKHLNKNNYNVENVQSF